MKADRSGEIKQKGLAIMSFWDTLLVPFEKKQELISLVYYVQGESDNEITEMSALSLEFLNKVVQEHDKLREEMNQLVLKKKSKLLKILKTTHLLSKFNDKDVVNPIAAFQDLKAQISEAQNLASQRADIVAKMEFIQHADEEIDWYKESEKAGATLQDERSIKARTLRKGLPRILRNLKAELASRAEPFEGDALKIVKHIEDKATSAGTSTEKTFDKAGTSTAVTEPTGVRDMEVEPAEVQPLPPDQVLPLQPTQVQPLQPTQVLPLFPLPPHFGFVPRAPRTRREQVEEVVLPPAPPSPPSPPAPPSPPDRY